MTMSVIWVIAPIVWGLPTVPASSLVGAPTITPNRAVTATIETVRTATAFSHCR